MNNGQRDVTTPLLCSPCIHLGITRAPRVSKINFRCVTVRPTPSPSPRPEQRFQANPDAEQHPNYAGSQCKRPVLRSSTSHDRTSTLPLINLSNRGSKNAQPIQRAAEPRHSLRLHYLLYILYLHSSKTPLLVIHVSAALYTSCSRALARNNIYRGSENTPSPRRRDIY